MVKLENVYQLLKRNNNQGLDAKTIATLATTQNPKEENPVLPSEIENLVRANPYHFLISKNSLISLKHPTLR